MHFTLDKKALYIHLSRFKTIYSSGLSDSSRGNNHIFIFFSKNMPESRGGIDGTLYLSDNIPLMHFTVTLLHTVWLSEILLTKPL